MKEVKASPNESEIRQPFENFKRLAKNLIAVPKKELDEKLDEYDRNKKRKKRKAKT